MTFSCCTQLSRFPWGCVHCLEKLWKIITCGLCSKITFSLKPVTRWALFVLCTHTHSSLFVSSHVGDGRACFDSRGGKSRDTDYREANEEWCMMGRDRELRFSWSLPVRHSTTSVYMLTQISFSDNTVFSFICFVHSSKWHPPFILLYLRAACGVLD